LKKHSQAVLQHTSMYYNTIVWAHWSRSCRE